jgi:hypothetical protein
LEVNKINSRRLDGLKASGAKEAISVAAFRPGATASSVAAAAAKYALLAGREFTLRVLVGGRYILMEDVDGGKAGSAVVVSRISRNNASGGLQRTCCEVGIVESPRFLVKPRTFSRTDMSGKIQGSLTQLPTYFGVCSDRSPRDGSYFALPC